MRKRLYPSWDEIRNFHNPLTEGEEKIVLGDTGKPGLGGMSGAKALIPIPVSDENISESSEPLGDTGKPGLGGSSGARI